jgi:hypothetical protein
MSAIAGLPHLRLELAQALDDRLRNEHDLPLVMFMLMSAIAAGISLAADLAVFEKADAHATTKTLRLLESRGLCLIDEVTAGISVRGFTLAGNLLYRHATEVFLAELCALMGTHRSADPSADVRDAVDFLRQDGGLIRSL